MTGSMAEGPHPRESGPYNPVLVALDVPTAEDAARLARELSPHVGGFKVGLELLTGPGPAIVGVIGRLGKPVFADAKLHDIPNTVRAAAPHLKRAANGGGSSVVINRLLLDSHFTGLVRPRDGARLPAIDTPDANVADVSVLDILLNEELRDDFASECENLLLFDRVYDAILANLDSIAREAGTTHSLSRESVQKLIDAALEVAVRDQALAANGAGVDEMRQRLFDWYSRVSAQPRASAFFRAVEEWKQTAFPHISDALFVVVTFLFERLLASYLRARLEGRRYEGRISPRSIGRRKDFWNRLSHAYRDLLIQNVLTTYKRRRDTGHERFIGEFFDDFRELNGDLLSSDPCEFPGFRSSIEGALNAGQPPCGVVTGIGTFKNGADGLPCGVVISNVGFQAGSFDMASAEKFCKLLVHCAEQQLPLICFISSGGMQTKEGAGALFSMAAINDRLTRFVRDFDLPAIVFGYGDCTGGAQASFVTHPLVQTYYLSGASMPFAGQIVVTSYLPAESHLANYLASEPGAMQGLVKHPFHTDLDDELRRIDPDIPVPEESVVDVVNRVMAGVLEQERPAAPPLRATVPERDLLRPVRRMLIHARGCTAVKLVRVAQRKGVGVVLVQSDPDMDSVPVDMLGDNDTVVCIGGNTPDESYLNALSVIEVAEQQKVDSLHPGIGFLSESSQFAELVRSRAINFVGPPVTSMNTMGNKSNAIAAAMRLGVPVVPGSHGIVTDPDRAAANAASIGYPVLVKAVHGGGGKGIQVVESADRFHELFHRVSVEARAAFGNGDVYLERYITRLRHIEVQLLRDAEGNTRVLGLRDCSVQRDRQKVIEESGSTSLPDELADEVMRHSAALAEEVDYVGAGTVEFIHDLDGGAAYFMEMNTRLQVEHPVTERVSGVDIVGEQLRIAAGESIADLAMADDGYAIEARINAERIVRSGSGELSFQPSPGQIVTCEWPEADDIDVISIAAGGQVRLALLRQHGGADHLSRPRPCHHRRAAGGLAGRGADHRHLHQHRVARARAARRGFLKRRLRHRLSASFLPTHRRGRADRRDRRSRGRRGAGHWPRGGGHRRQHGTARAGAVYRHFLSQPVPGRASLRPRRRNHPGNANLVPTGSLQDLHAASPRRLQRPGQRTSLRP